LNGRTRPNQIGTGLEKFAHVLRCLNPTRGFDSDVRGRMLPQPSDLLRCGFANRPAAGILQIRHTCLDSERHGAFSLRLVQKR
jgi:hypothetical protein